MNIVIIDDDAAFRRSTEILLSERGHWVASFADPKDAVSFFADAFCREYLPVDVLLLDHVFPDSFGTDLLPQFRKWFPQSKVILVSGHTDLVDIELLRRAGECAFLSKPLDLDALYELVGEPVLC